MRLSVIHFIRKSIEGQRAWRSMAVLLTVFAVLAVSLRYSALRDADLRLSREVQEHGSPLLTAVMRAITVTGNAVVLLTLGSIAALFALVVRRARAAEAIAFSLLSLPANVALKAIWHRARPDAGLVSVAVRESGTSFPSGHAMGSTAVYGLLAALAWLHLPPGRVRIAVVAVLSLLPIAIGATRVYLGAHWFSDVVGGTAIGLAFLVPILRWYLARLQAEEREASPDGGASGKIENGNAPS